jgi:uncharacterized protein (DUF362 family)
MNKPALYSTRIDSLQNSLFRLLDAANLTDLIPSGKTILLKPNLVGALVPPVTTPVELIALLIEYLQQNLPKSNLIIGEGTGSLDYETEHSFQQLGYAQLGLEKNIPLLDLNHEKLTKKEDPACTKWPVMHLPSILDEVYLLSVPVLKVHTLAKVTLTMKNMMGCVPPSHFRGSGYWKKSAFHDRIHESIFDLNRYRTPDFTILDASIGMTQAHLWGAHCNPAVNILAASADPVAIDVYGSLLLGKNWKDIGHIKMADTVLGSAETTATHI